MTINQEMVDILNGLKTQWRILKDDTKTKKERTVACGKVCKLSDQAKEADPTWELLDMNNTKYAEFLPTEYVAKSDVNWQTDGKELVKPIIKAHELVRQCEVMAVCMTEERLPKERDDSQKFGMIVGHYTKLLLEAYIHQNS